MEMPNVGYEVTKGVGKEYWSCDHVGDNVGCFSIGQVMIEMVVDEQDDKVEKVVTKEWTKANSSVLDSKPGSCNQTCISISFHLFFCHG